jgi:hypothetical protein
MAQSSSNKIMNGLLYKNYNSSNGAYSSSRKSGPTNDIKYKSQTDNNIPISATTARTEDDDKKGFYPMKYRGIENLWGAGRVFIDGAFVKNKYLYYNTDYTSYNNELNYTKSSLEVPNSGIVHTVWTDGTVNFPSSVRSDGSYDNQLNNGNSEGTSYLYLAGESETGQLGLYSYNIISNSKIANIAYRMVKKPL